MYITDDVNDRLQFWPTGAASAITLALNPYTHEIYITSDLFHAVVSYPSGFIFGAPYLAGITPPLLSYPRGTMFGPISNSLIISSNG